MMPMLPLIRTLFDIAVLRKGPEDLPHSWVVVYMCVGLWILGLVATTVLLSHFSTQDAAVSLATWVLGLFCYALLLGLTGLTHRMMQTQSALIGCGALISFASLAAVILLTPFVGVNFAGVAAVLVLLWSVPMKGHIIARAINQHLTIGIVIAIAIFALQLVFSNTLSATVESSAA